MKMFDAGKTRMIGLPHGEKNYDNMLSRFHLIPERYGQADGRTDKRTDRFAISISRIRMLTRDKRGGEIMSGLEKFRENMSEGGKSRSRLRISGWIGQLPCFGIFSTACQ